MRANSLFGLLLLIFSSLSFAGGGGGVGGSIVYDPTNHIETAITSARAVYAETQRATQIYNQILHYKQAVLQNTNLDPTVAAGMIGQAQKDMTNLQTYIGGMNKMITDNSQLQNVLQNRQIDYSNSGLTSADYVKREKQRIQDGDQQRAQIAQHEAAVLKNVNNDAQFIADAQAKIPGATQAQSAELMNMQLNKLLAQNSTLIQLQTENSLAAKAKEKQLEERNGVDNANALKFGETMKGNTRSLINNIGSGSQGGSRTVTSPAQQGTGSSAANLSPAAKAALGL